MLSIFPYVGEAPNRIRWRKAELAMALRSKNPHDDLHGIRTRHWHDLAQKAGGPTTWASMQDLVERVPAALKAVEARLPASFPAPTWEAIHSGMLAQARRFEAGHAD